MSPAHRNRIHDCRFLVSLLFLAPSMALAEIGSAKINELSTAVRQVEAGAKGHDQAMIAMKELQTASADDIPALLVAMNSANPLAVNWLQNVVESIAGNAATIPAEPIQAFLLDRKNAAQSRRLAYDLLLQRDPGIQSLLVPGMLDDPCLDLRWDAVEQLIKSSEAMPKKEAQIQGLQKALDASRDSEQVDKIIASLAKLDHKINVAQHYGFLAHWKLVGPFDNTSQKGFDVAYPPESDTSLTTYPGKSEPVTWKEHVSTAEDGIIKLTDIYGPVKGAIVYALAELDSDKEQPAEVRVGCINACKVWVNGQPLMAHEKYHQAMMVDQYVGATKLKAGKNAILMKICQNEQTEAWAQDWMYQLRVTTPEGIAIREPAAAK